MSLSNPKLQIPSSNATAQTPNPKPRSDRWIGISSLGFRLGLGSWESLELGIWSLGFDRCCISLFITCYNDTLFPETGKAVVTVLERLGHQVEFREAQTCCGQMHYNTGYAAEALPLMRRMLEVFRGSGLDLRAVGVVRRDDAGSLSEDGRRSPATRRCRPAVEDFLGRVFEFSELLVDKLRRHRRRRVVPAHRHAAHVLSLAAVAAPHRPAGAAARRGARPRARRAAAPRRVLRLRRHVRGEERRRVDGDGRTTRSRASPEPAPTCASAGDNSCLMQIGGLLHRQGARSAACTWRRFWRWRADLRLSRKPLRGCRLPAQPESSAEARSMIRVGDAATRPGVSRGGRDGLARQRAAAAQRPPRHRRHPRQARARRRRDARLAGSCAKPAGRSRRTSSRHLDTYLPAVRGELHARRRTRALGAPTPTRPTASSST